MSLNEEIENLLNDKTESIGDYNENKVDEKNKNADKPKQIIKRNDLSSDEKQMRNFMGPMLQELEKAIADNMQVLDKLEEEFLGDSKRERQNRLVAHIPEEIRERKPIEAILRNLEQMINDTTEIQNQPAPIDPSQKQTHDLIQTKLLSSSSFSLVSNQLEEDNKKIEPAIDFVNSKLGDLNNLACVAHSLTAYLVTANIKRNGEKLKSLTIKLYDSVNLWISRLFRFYDSSVLFHDQESDGLTRMCNMMLNFKYSEYQKNGYESIKKQPLIYISIASKYAQLEYRELITIQLGLPLSCIRLVKISKEDDHTLDKIDVARFLHQVENDVKEGYMPIALVANAGSYTIGQSDDINQLNSICYSYKMWLHLEGIYLSTLAMYSIPTEVQPVTSGDSITLNLATWLGIPSLSYVTLYKNVKNSGSYIQPFNSYITTLQRCLPYWCVLQAVGHEGVVERIKYASDMSATFKDILEKQKPYLKILSFKDTTANQQTTTTRYSFQDLLAKAISFLTFVDLYNPVIVFRVDPSYVNERLFLFTDIEIEKKDKEVKKEINSHKEEFLKMIQDIEPFTQQEIDKKKAEEEAKINIKKQSRIIYPDEIDEYADTLTTWLCDLINSLHKNIEFELIEIENEGVCIRYSPFDHVNIFGTNFTDVKNFSQSLKDIIEILDASIKCKSKFKNELKDFKNLITVNVPKWAGIGAVRYIPDYLLDKKDEIERYQSNKIKAEKNGNLEKEPEKNDVTETKDNDLGTHINESSNDQTESKSIVKTERNDEDLLIEKYINEINDLNEQLVKKLQAQDNAFSSGEASDQMVAVKFGMVKDLEDIRKLAFEVQQVGKEVEESSRFIEKMSDIIRQGIEKANEELKRESEQKIVQEGLLRQIPLVSGLYNWFSPPPTVNAIGRTFNLQSGKIASTEVTYKYHIQVEESKEEESIKKNSERRLSAISIKSTVSNEVANSDELNDKKTLSDSIELEQKN